MAGTIVQRPLYLAFTGRRRGRHLGGTLRNWRATKIRPSFLKIGRATLRSDTCCGTASSSTFAFSRADEWIEWNSAEGQLWGQQHHLVITVCATARLHQADLLDADRFFSDVPGPDLAFSPEARWLSTDSVD
jgi:hypothetical protein